MNPVFVPIVVNGSKLVPKPQPDGSCDGCQLRDMPECFYYPCVEDGEHIIYVEEPNVPQTQPR